MTLFDQYLHIVHRFSELRRTQQLLQEQASAYWSIREAIHPLIEDFSKASAMQASLSNAMNLLNSPALKLAREANLSISKLSMSPEIHNLAKETSKMAELWKTQFAPVSEALESINASQLGIQSHLVKISDISILAEHSMARVKLEEIGSIINISKECQSSLRQMQIDLSESYSRLFKSFEAPDFSIFSVRPDIISLPPIEFYTSNRVIESISLTEGKILEEEETLITEISHEIRDDIEMYLSRLDPSLIRLWRGAKESLASDNPDSTRHFITSLRELLTHVIHKLAPDEQVKSWTTDPKHYHKNKPTRRSRLLYICREINYPPFSQFLDKDIDAVLECINLFQYGTHKIDSPFITPQLQSMMLRTESSIRFLLDIGMKTNDT